MSIDYVFLVTIALKMLAHHPDDRVSVTNQRIRKPPPRKRHKGKSDHLHTQFVAPFLGSERGFMNKSCWEEGGGYQI